MKTLKKAFYFPLLFLVFFTTSLYSYAESGVDNNDTNHIEVITDMDGITTSTTGTLTGDSIHNDKDYYKFTVDAGGDLDIIRSSPNGHDYHLKIGSTPGGNEYYGDVKTQNDPIPTIKLRKGDTVYFYVKETGSDKDKYKLEFDFKMTIKTKIYEYRFDDCEYKGSAGEVVGSQGGVNGTTYGGVETNSTDSKLCSSASFDGTNDYIDFGDNFDDILGTNNDTFTITGWIYPRRLGTSNTQKRVIFNKEGNLQVSLTDSGKLRVHMIADNGTKVKGSFSSVVADSWNFIALSYDGSTLTVMIDGKVVGTTTTANGVLTSGSKFTLSRGTTTTITVPIIGTINFRTTTKQPFDGLIDELKLFDTSLDATAITNIYNNEKLGKNYLGQDRTCPVCKSYCESRNLTEGFHIIDPDGGVDDENSYEIYCDMTSPRAPRDLIALPLKNDYNNFVFKNDKPSANYYASADAAKKADSKNEFNYLQVNISNNGTISVAPNSIAQGSANEGYFSNINLIGTPFAIDWANTTLSNCDTSKLRIGASDQAVKINTLDYTKGRCKVDKMQLKLLNKYKYLTYLDIDGTGPNAGKNDEILEETCRQIFEKVPDDASHLPTTNGGSDGYFWVDPDMGGRVSTDKVDTKFRPFVAYCKYQQDIKQAWTFVMALDGKVTNSKNDIHTMSEVRQNPSIYHDTCSQLGLLFYVPNTHDTFDRVRKHLLTTKNEWINYTGTIREKYKMYLNNTAQEYYEEAEGFNEIWPYGPFGLYFPQNGNSGVWGGKKVSIRGEMSGRCMNSGVNSGAATCTDYTKQVVSNDDGTLGIMGWRTTLRDMVEAGTVKGITAGKEFWIADVGAGNYVHAGGNNPTNGNPECSITSPGSNRATSGACDNQYYEPNGNYIKNKWLNFVADSRGNIYHNDDYNDFYSYYDYMCMAWDNYYSFERYGPIKGPFEVIKNDPALSAQVGNEPFAAPADIHISTSIVNKDTNFDVLLLDQNRTMIINDQNISAGVFLSELRTITGRDEIKNLHYYGQVGVNDDFNLTSNPRGIINLNTESPYPLLKLDRAHPKLFFKFNYCVYGGSWDTCWDVVRNGGDTNATCKTGYDSSGKPNSPCITADSDFFAARPDRFAIASVDGVLNSTGLRLIVKAEDVNISYRANDMLGVETIDYNESFSNLDTSIHLINTGLSCATDELYDTNQSLYSFINGQDAHVYTLEDVGEYDFKLQEINGSEFAKIDVNDTAWVDRQITPNNVTLFIKPHHFRISTVANINHNTDGNFSYVSNDFENMAAKLDFNVTAESEHNNTTLNYTRNCYAADFNLDANYTTPVNDASSVNTFSNVTKIHYAVKDKNDNNITIQNTQSPLSARSFIKHGDKIPKILFTNDINGSARVIVKFNFERETNKPLNPFVINLHNINVADTNTPLVVNTINSGVDLNATFVYGRAMGPRRAGFTNCVDHKTNCISAANSPRIVVQIYADQDGNKSIDALQGATHEGTHDSRWWTSPFHDLRNGSFIKVDGNITTPAHPSITEIAGLNVNQYSLTKDSNFRYKVRLRYNGADGYIKRAHLKHYPSSWLIYDDAVANATFNKFNFNFITEGWSGKHESGSTSKTKAAHRTNRRILW